MLVDDEPGSAGSLTSWSLTFVTGERFTTSNSVGSYAIENLPAGSYRVREQTPAGFRITEPTPNSDYSVNLGGGGGLGGRDFGSVADTTAPSVTFTPVNPDPRNNSVYSVQMVFSERVSGLDLSELSLTRDFGPNLLTGSQFLSMSNNGQTWNLNNLTAVTSTAGFYRLNLSTALGTLILDRAGNALLAPPPTETWTVDVIAPTITSLNRLNANPTGAANVTWRLSSSEQLSGLTAANFALIATGLTGTAITAVTYNSFLNVWDITAGTGSGAGTLGLNLVNTTNASDLAGNPISNVPFTGAVFSVDRTPAQVTMVQVNAPPTSSRSRVTSLVATFDSVVTFSGAPVNAFALTRTGPGAPIGPVGLSAAVLSAEATIVTLSFTNTTEFGSLIDGRYMLIVDAAQVSDLGGPMASNYNFDFHRLFGDADGDADVDAGDFGQFRVAFGTTNDVFDFEDDNDIDAADFGNFRLRFGVSI